MPSSFLANSASNASCAPSSSQNDTVSPSTSSDMWNYLWIPILISLSKELSPAKAESTILLPSQRQQRTEDSVSTLTVPLARCPRPDAKLNYRPVIGILSHPGDGASGRLNNASNASYIAASYVKFVESAGARVIPLIYNEPEEILYQVNDLVID